MAKIKDKQRDWTNSEIEKLKELYLHYSADHVAKELNRSKSSIVNKAFRLQLEKSSDFKQRYMSIKNKLSGRDITKELTISQALKCKSKVEFQKLDPSCYGFARVNNILEEVCSHMLPLQFSIPQLLLRDIMDNLLGSNSLYDTRRIIKPYEIDVYYHEFKIAFEYNGKGWHINNKNDEIKQQMCISNEITLFTIKENSRRYEEDIKNQLIKFLPQINKVTNKNITEDDVRNYVPNNVFLTIHNKDSLVKLAQSYDSFKKFRKEHFKEYEKIRKLKIIDEATQHMKDRRNFHNEESLKKTISKYIYLGDFIKNDFGSYSHIKKNKLEYLINHLIRRNRYS